MQQPVLAVNLGSYAQQQESMSAACNPDLMLILCDKCRIYDRL